MNSFYPLEATIIVKLRFVLSPLLERRKIHQLCSLLMEAPKISEHKLLQTPNQLQTALHPQQFVLRISPNPTHPPIPDIRLTKAVKQSDMSPTLQAWPYLSIAFSLSAIMDSGKRHHFELCLLILPYLIN